MAQLIGTGQNQVPVNGLLGTMAFQSNKSVNIQGGIVNVLSISATATTASASTTTGALQVAGGAGIGGNLNVGGTSSFGSAGSVNGDITVANAVNLVNGTSGSSNMLLTSNTFAGGTALTMSNTGGSTGTSWAFEVGGWNKSGTSGTGVYEGNLVIRYSNTVSMIIQKSTGYVSIGTTLPTAALTVTGGASISGASTFTNTTVSAGTTTGALVVAGGVGIGGNLNVGGTIIGSGVRNTSSATAPTSPTPVVGDYWYNTLTDDVYRYSSDGTSNYWLDVTGPAISGVGRVNNGQFIPNVYTTSSIVTATISVNFTDQYNITALSTATTFSTTSTTAPGDGQKLMIRVLDNGTAQTLNWNPTFTIVGVTLPTTTVATKTTYVGCVYNALASRWDVIAVSTQA